MELNEASLCCTWKQETYRVCKNAPRRSARQAHPIDARSAASGTLRQTLQASIKIHGGACIAFAYHVMLSSNVAFAKENTRRNISAPLRGKLESRREDCACAASPKPVVVGSARPVNNGSLCSNFPCLSPGGLLGKMEHRYAMNAVLPACRLLSANARRQQA